MFCLHLVFIRMEDVLKLNVEEEELRELLEEDEGDEWPERGMTCPVSGCSSKGHLFQHLIIRPITTASTEKEYSYSVALYVGSKTLKDLK